MDEPSREKAKARRDVRILWWCVAIGVVLPAVLFFVLQLHAAR